MKHAKIFRKLSRQRSHYRALMRNLSFSLFQHERIETTLTKAKEMRRFTEKLISLGKRGDLHSRRRAMALMGNKIIHKTGEKEDIIGKVFGDLAARYKSRNGGYTRIIKLGRPRPGDAAPMAIIELVDAPEKPLKKIKENEPKSEAS